MTVAGRLALWLAVLLAVWSVAAALAALRASRADIAVQAARGLAAAATAATAALGILVAALGTHDFGVRFVAARSSVLMPARFIPNAVLGAPAGALLALAAGTGIASLVVLRRATGARERTWIVAAAAGLMALALVIAASRLPFARTFGFRADGAVLSPDLEHGNAVLHAVALLGGSVCAAAAFITTFAALAAGRLADRWTADVRHWNAVAWCLFFVAAVAGARWHALNPLRGPWLAAPATALWLLPCAMGAWLVHLDAGRPSPERTVTRMLLVAGTFVAACGAVSLDGGAFIRGVADVTDTRGRWFGIAALAALLLTIAIVRRARGSASQATTPVGEVAGEVAGGVAGDVAGDVAGGVAGGRVAGIVAHAGFAIVAAAAIGSYYTHTHVVRLADTEIFRAKDPFGRQWSFASEGASTLKRENYSAITYTLRPERDGVRGDVVSADARSYGLADEDTTGIAAFTAGVISGALVEARVSVEDPSITPVAMRITFVPLASWLVPGAVLVVLGTLLPLFAGPASNAPTERRDRRRVVATG